MGGYQSMCEQLRSVRARFASAPTSLHRLQLLLDVHNDDLHPPPELQAAIELPDGRNAIRTPKGSEQFIGGVIGTCLNPQVVVQQVSPLKTLRVPGRTFTASYFGFHDDLEAGHTAHRTYIEQASHAWRCLPPLVRKTLVAPDYVDPSHHFDESTSWTLSVCTIAWRPDAPEGLRADREIRLSAGQTCNIENIIRLPTSAPADEPFGQSQTQQYSIDTLRRDLKRWVPEDVITDVRVPPPRFFAILKPDLFLASDFAIQHLLEKYEATKTLNSSATKSISSKAHGVPAKAAFSRARASNDSPPAKKSGWTAVQLRTEAGIGRTTFKSIRAKAGLVGGGTGNHSYTYTKSEVSKLANAAKKHAAGKKLWLGAAAAWSKLAATGVLRKSVL